jgi:hypothetical protein
MSLPLRNSSSTKIVASQILFAVFKLQYHKKIYSKWRILLVSSSVYVQFASEKTFFLLNAVFAMAIPD